MEAEVCLCLVHGQKCNFISVLELMRLLPPSWRAVNEQKQLMSTDGEQSFHPRSAAGSVSPVGIALARLHRDLGPVAPAAKCYSVDECDEAGGDQ